jgi:hypothetical protein
VATQEKNTEFGRFTLFGKVEESVLFIWRKVLSYFSVLLAGHIPKDH